MIGVMIPLGFSTSGEKSLEQDELSYSEFEYVYSKDKAPILSNSDYYLEEWITGLQFPTTMTFIGEDLLVLEKNSGKVIHIKNGKIIGEAAQLNPKIRLYEDGLLGIASDGSQVFITITEETDKKTLDELYLQNPVFIVNESSLQLPEFGVNILLKLYKYDWDGQKLINPVLIKIFPGHTDADHLGGAMTVDSKNNLYLIIGEEGPLQYENLYENRINGIPIDGSIIFQLNTQTLESDIYAIGIKNSFGIEIDKKTENVWFAEVSTKAFDEINLAMPKMNSGHNKISGPLNNFPEKSIPKIPGFEYDDPKFSWEWVVTPTGIFFPNSTIYGDLNNSLLIGDWNNGFVYELKLNDSRDGFIFSNPKHEDNVLNVGDGFHDVVFGTGFGGITDIEQGPDGILYLLSIQKGSIFKLIPNDIYEKKIVSCFEIFPKNHLQNCNLSKINLEKINLSMASLSNVDLDQSNLKNSIFTLSKFNNSTITNADVSMSHFSGFHSIGSDFSSTSFYGSDLSNANIEQTIMQKSNFTRSIISGTSINSSDLFNSSFDRTYIQTSRFYDSNIQNSDFSNSVLRFNEIHNSDLSNAKFIDSKMHYNKFINSDLSNVDFRGSDLFSSNFTGSNLDGANFLGIYPYSIDFTNAIFTENTKMDSCLKDSQSFEKRFYNKILREIRELDPIFDNIFGTIILSICN